MSADKPIVVGAVLYDPKVTVIWGIIRDFFEQHRCPIDVSFYKNYELQVDAMLARRRDIAGNSPLAWRDARHRTGGPRRGGGPRARRLAVAWPSQLAWLDALHRTGGRCRAIAMRDTDRDRRTPLVVRPSAGLASVHDPRGKTVALGAKDSPQASLIPIEMLRSFAL